jgi:hypothetical protein
MQIGVVYYTFLAQAAFTFGAFFGKNVAFKRFLIRDFAGARYFKTFFCTRVGFNLWHVFTTFRMIPDGRHRTDDALWEPFGQCATCMSLQIGVQM